MTLEEYQEKSKVVLDNIELMDRKVLAPLRRELDLLKIEYARSIARFKIGEIVIDTECFRTFVVEDIGCREDTDTGKIEPLYIGKDDDGRVSLRECLAERGEL